MANASCPRWRDAHQRVVASESAEEVYAKLDGAVSGYSFVGLGRLRRELIKLSINFSKVELAKISQIQTLALIALIELWKSSGRVKPPTRRSLEQ